MLRRFQRVGQIARQGLQLCIGRAQLRRLPRIQLRRLVPRDRIVAKILYRRRNAADAIAVMHERDRGLKIAARQRLHPLDDGDVRHGDDPAEQIARPDRCRHDTNARYHQHIAQWRQHLAGLAKQELHVAKCRPAKDQAEAREHRAESECDQQLNLDGCRFAQPSYRCSSGKWTQRHALGWRGMVNKMLLFWGSALPSPTRQERNGDMTNIRVGLIDITGALEPAFVQAVASALNTQVTRDLPLFWHVKATVEYLPHAHKIPAGVWPVRLIRTAANRRRRLPSRQA